MYYEKFKVNMWLSVFFFFKFEIFISYNNLNSCNYNDYQTINHIIIPYAFGKRILVSYLINITRHVIGKKNPCESLGILMQNGKRKMVKNDEKDGI